MRSIWKGSISFGLVTIPVKLYSATQENDVAFHQVHREDAGRIRYKRVCSVDGEEVSYSEIAKGYELPSGEIVVLTDEDFADLPLTTSRSIDVLQFVPLEQVDPVYFAKSYYLAPEAAGTKPYVLLSRALEESGQVALVKIALRSRESLATLRVRDGVFVLETMLWPDEIREPDFGFLDEDVEVRPQELQMATSLIETLTGDFDPTAYHDDYRTALQAVIDAKIEGHEVAAPAEAPAATGTVVDLMAALRASVDAARQSRGEGGAPVESPAEESGDAVTPKGTSDAGSRRGANGRARAGGADTSTTGERSRTRTGTAGARTASGDSAGGRSSEAGSPAPASPGRSRSRRTGSEVKEAVAQSKEAAGRRPAARSSAKPAGTAAGKQPAADDAPTKRSRARGAAAAASVEPRPRPAAAPRRSARKTA